MKVEAEHIGGKGLEEDQQEEERVKEKDWEVKCHQRSEI